MNFYEKIIAGVLLSWCFQFGASIYYAFQGNYQWLVANLMNGIGAKLIYDAARKVNQTEEKDSG